MRENHQNMNNKNDISIENKIKQRGRTWEIGDCYICRECLMKDGEGDVIVTRKHKGGKITVGCYLIDRFCTGVKDTFYNAMLDDYEYNKFLQKVSGLGIEKVDYVEAHNWIFGALEYAAEAGIKPHKDFAVTKYLLEDDEDERIPIIEYEFGDNGKYHLICQTQQEANKYLPALERNIGVGNFLITIGVDDYEYENEDELEENPFFKQYPKTQYSYQHPQYPENLIVKTEGLMDFLSMNSCPSKDEIDKILSLDHDVLREDLQNIILCELGKYHNNNNEDVTEWTPVIAHALLLLGECGNKTSIDVILEVLRQDSEFYDFIFGDYGEDIFVPALTKLAQNQLPVLLDFMKEPGLYYFSKTLVSVSVVGIFISHPEKRVEIIEWYRNLLQFYYEKITESYDYCDPSLIGLMFCDILDIHGEELIPLVQKLYETDKVDICCCGDFNAFCKGLEERPEPHPSEVTSVYENFERFHDMVD